MTTTFTPGGTIIVSGGQTLATNSITAETTNSNLQLSGNGTGIVLLPQTTDSTSTTTGALQVSGGAGIAKHLTVGVALAVQSTTNQIALGTTNTTTISATAPTAARVYTLPDAGANANILLSAGTQTVGGNMSFTNGIAISATTNQIALGTTNTTTLSATTPAASRVYTIPDAGANANVLLSAGTQTVGGSMTFTNAITVSATSSQIALGTTHTTTISATAPTASRVYTLPDAGASANIILSAGTQTIGGSMTFTNAIAISATTNQIAFGTTNTTTISATAPTASRVYTLPDAGANANILLSAGTQSVTGATTFSNTLTVHGATSINTTTSDGDVNLGNTSNNVNVDGPLIITNGGSPIIKLSAATLPMFLDFYQTGQSIFHRIGAYNASEAFISIEAPGSQPGRLAVDSIAPLYNTAITINTGLALANATVGYALTAMNYFEDVTGAFSDFIWGTITTGSVPWRIQRHQNRVTFFVPGFTIAGTANSTISSGNGLPTRFLPPSSMSGVTVTQVSGLFPYSLSSTSQIGVCTIAQSTGVLTLSPSAGGNFNGTTWIFFAIMMEWFVA